MSAPNPAQAKPTNLGLIRPVNIASLQFIEAAQRAKLVSACQQYWTLIDSRPQDSKEYRDAIEKLTQMTKSLKEKYNQWNARQQASQQGAVATGATAGGARPISQGQPGGQPAQGQQPGGIQQQQSVQQTSQSQAGPTAVPQNPPGITPQLISHIKSFPWLFPPEKPQGTPEGDAWLKEQQNQYLKILVAMESAKKEITRLDNGINQRRQAGQDVPPELFQAKQRAQANYQTANQMAVTFRNQHAKGGGPMAAPQAGAAPTANTATKTEQTGTTANSSTAAPGAQHFKLQMPGQTLNLQSGHSGQQQPQGSQGVNQAVEAARNAANVARTSLSPVVAGQQQQQQQPQATSTAQTSTSFPASQQHPTGTMQQGPGTTAVTRPSLNTHQPAATGQPMSGAPHSAGGPTPVTGPPVPLTHAAAVTAAARSHSDQVKSATPQTQAPVTATYHQQQLGNREHNGSASTRMPIPKFLPPSATAMPSPVAMGPGRPTLAGPSNGIGGMLGQPTIEKHAGILVEGDGQGVLSKNKLGELVREVGGSEESLTPEVEDILLSVADEFVDNVITAACRVAKLRDGAELQLRDIQTVLERNYNIRIPGYSLDETRVIRKFHPAPGWQQKMNAVQAAKVMGGKTDI